jgi:feruloyl esterase
MSIRMRTSRATSWWRWSIARWVRASSDPAVAPFIEQGRKLILYHGTSDPAIPAERSIMFYHALATTLHGMPRAQASVRLFLVPGMQHCSGGIGPDQFDTLSAIEAWVEHGKAPDAIEASTKPDASAPHSLPLCPYPQQARYSGSGALGDLANWKCAVPGRETARSGHGGRGQSDLSESGNGVAK